MPLAKGPYDDVAASIIAQLDARAVFIVIVGGTKGHGTAMAMDVSCVDPYAVPALLRKSADLLEVDLVSAGYPKPKKPPGTTTQ